jgi:type VI secretion system protein ImpM
VSADVFPTVNGVGMIGKAPAHADFVRIDAGDPSAEELLSWIEETEDSLRRAGAALPALPTYFVFCSPTVRSALVGVLAPSRDQVGRTFPLAAFASVPIASLSGHFTLIPLAFGDFLAAGAVLLDEAPSLSAPQLAERARRLPPPTEREWQRADERRRLLLDQSSEPWLRNLEETGGTFGPHYAFHTLITACKERTAEPPRTPLVLLCPLASEGPLPWLELVSRLLRWRSQTPPFVWTEAAPARLLLCLGTSTAASLSYLARPETSAPSLWPLRSQSASSREAARQAFSAQQRTTIEEGHASIAALISSLAR